mgnify:CR=1 FL=1
MENQALDIIDMLYAMIAEAWGVPLGNDKCIVERDKALGLLDDLKAVLPQELSEARRLVNARNEFVSHAKQEAENIRRSASEEASAMINREAVLLEAQKQAKSIVDDAEKKSREIRRAASAYLDSALRQTEDAVTSALDNVRSVRTQLKSISAPEPEGRANVKLQDVEDIDLLGQ